MSDVFQEVEEEYRREQLAQLWNKYKIPVIAGVTALVLAVAGYQGWSYWYNEQALASSRAFDAAVKDLDADNRKSATARFEKLSKQAVGGYAVLSRLHEAGVKGQSGDEAAAIKIYDEVAQSNSDPLFSGLAAMRAAVLTVEKGSLAEIKKRLDPLVANESPWKAGALEILAYASWRAGKKEEALGFYKTLLALAVAPEKMKRRATEMKALIEGGFTLSDLNKQLQATQPTVSPGFLPFGMDLTAPETPGSLLGPADVPPLPDPTQTPSETPPPVTP